MTIANIAFINEATVVTDDEVSALVDALQIQIVRDFAPAYGQDAKLVFVPKTQVPDPSFWQMVVLDTSDQAGALGYHDITATGQPLGKAFAKSCKDDGVSWTVDVSHELVEMLADPQINTVVTLYDASNNQSLVAFESADACEDDSFGYQINGILVSDFVLPSWFGQRPNNPGVPANQLDYQNKITTSLEVAVANGNPASALGPGGYIGLQGPDGQWTQVLPANDAPKLTPGGRAERRNRGRVNFVRSITHDEREQRREGSQA